MSRIIPAVLAALMVVVLSGCYETEPEVSTQDQVAAEQRTEEGGGTAAEGGEDAAGGGDAATFVAVDIAYEEAPDEVPAGEVQVQLVNEGSIVHDVVIEELGDELVVEAPGGETAQGTVALEPGEYTYYCSVPGHRPAGMEGTLTVTE